MISQSTIDQMQACEDYNREKYQKEQARDQHFKVAARRLICDLADHFDETRTRHAPFWSGDDTAALVVKALKSASDL